MTSTRYCVGAPAGTARDCSADEQPREGEQACLVRREMGAVCNCAYAVGNSQQNVDPAARRMQVWNRAVYRSNPLTPQPVVHFFFSLFWRIKGFILQSCGSLVLPIFVTFRTAFFVRSAAAAPTSCWPHRRLRSKLSATEPAWHAYTIFFFKSAVPQMDRDSRAPVVQQAKVFSRM